MLRAWLAEPADRMVPLHLGLSMEHAALEFWKKLEAERSATVS